MNEMASFYRSDKALPDVPLGGEQSNTLPSAMRSFEVADMVEAKDHSRQDAEWTSHDLQRPFNNEQLPPRRQSLMPQPLSSLQHEAPGSHERAADWQYTSSEGNQQQGGTVRTIADPDFVELEEHIAFNKPHHRPRSPVQHGATTTKAESHISSSLASAQQFSHSRQVTAESTSWLDTIDESGASSSSSVHSMSSSIGLRRKHIRTGSGATEAEFDAALDAAVEAAYDDGFEPNSEEEIQQDHDANVVSNSNSYLTSVKRNIDLAKQRVRDAEREAAIANAREHERRRRLQQHGYSSKIEPYDFYEDIEAEEEERMLEEMTREYILDDTDIQSASKTGIPRKADSSGLLAGTWGGLVGSQPLIAGNKLSTVIEYISPRLSSSEIETEEPRPFYETASNPPSSKLSDSQRMPLSASLVSKMNPNFGTIQSPGVRDRRLSGQRIRQLKIDTHARLPLSLSGPKTQPSQLGSPRSFGNKTDEPPKSASLPLDPLNNHLNVDSSDQPRPKSAGDDDAQFPNNDSPRSTLATSVSGIGPLGHSQSEADEPVASNSQTTSGINKPPNHSTLRENYSSSSLKSLKQQASTSTVAENSPSTSIGRAVSASSVSQRSDFAPVLPDLPASTVNAVDKNGLLVAGLSFLDCDILSPLRPGSPQKVVSNAPIPLEPCPESFLLRPFWLMRAIYQTIAHSRGGYISTRLFVPRDAWRVKNVKLKNVEEKVANCDLLTAALLNIQKVDTLDADAVLEELQAFELVLDQVQNQLGKKLGTDVGVNSSAAIFKASPATDDIGSLDGPSSKSAAASGKPFSSWRRLRSKHSVGTAIPPTTIATPQSRDLAKETLTIRSLPMTTATNPKYAKRDPTKVLGIGPHSQYMAALGRLCDAVQVLGELLIFILMSTLRLCYIDQIARQVEDPGLRLSSQTHVGLELCVRHAAEFFAFFVCRFALADIGMMLDKFVKRGSEWVLI